MSPETLVRVIAEVARVDAEHGLVHLPPCMRRDCRQGHCGKRWPGTFLVESRRHTSRPRMRPLVALRSSPQSGQWPWTAATCDWPLVPLPAGMHATWLIGASPIYAGDSPCLGENGQPEMRLLFFPVIDCQIIDTWHVIGLRGTAAMTLLSRMSSCPESVRCHAVNRSGHNTLGRSTPLELARCLTRRFIPPGLGWHRSALPQCVWVLRVGLSTPSWSWLAARPPAVAKPCSVTMPSSRPGWVAEATWRAAGAYLLETVREVGDSAEDTREYS